MRTIALLLSFVVVAHAQELPRSAVAAGVVRSAQAADEKIDIDAARTTLTKWIETQQLIARERKDWQSAEDVLKQRIELVQKEIATLEEKKAQFDANISEADKKKLELIEKDKALQENVMGMQDAVKVLENRSRALVALLPDPVKEKIKPLVDRMPSDPETTKVTLAERFQNVLGILNEANKANGEIALVKEVRTLGTGKPAQVDTIYVGLAQAYFVSAKGDTAGIGRPSQNGWEWTAANEIAPHVVHAIEILRNVHKPALIPLPVKIQ